jgi:hypothetical protein
MRFLISGKEEAIREWLKDYVRRTNPDADFFEQFVGLSTSFIDSKKKKGTIGVGQVSIEASRNCAELWRLSFARPLPRKDTPLTRDDVEKAGPRIEKYVVRETARVAMKIQQFAGTPDDPRRVVWELLSDGSIREEGGPEIFSATGTLLRTLKFLQESAPEGTEWNNYKKLVPLLPRDQYRSTGSLKDDNLGAETVPCEVVWVCVRMPDSHRGQIISLREE